MTPISVQQQCWSFPYKLIYYRIHSRHLRVVTGICKQREKSRLINTRFYTSPSYFITLDVLSFVCALIEIILAKFHADSHRQNLHFAVACAYLYPVKCYQYSGLVSI